MKKLSAADFAQLIAERHHHRQAFTLEPPVGHGDDIAFAYEVQERLVALIGGVGARTAGLKIGLTTPRMQQMCGVEEPVVGAIIEGRVSDSPGRATAGDFVRLGIECEIAMRLSRRFPDGEITPACALDYVDGVCAAFELIDDSGADYSRLSAVTVVADNAWNAGLVVGPLRAPGGLPTLAGLKGVLRRNGEVVDTGDSSDVLGSPVNALAWLGGHLLSRGRTLEPGQWVSTGAIVPSRFVAAGETYRFEIDGFAPVDLSIG